MNSDTLATCVEALNRWHDDLEAHDAIYAVDNLAEIKADIRAALDAALADLEAGEWEPVPQSLEYDLITYAIYHGQLEQGYRICRVPYESVIHFHLERKP